MCVSFSVKLWCPLARAAVLCFIISLAKLRIQECERWRRWKLFSFIPALHNLIENDINPLNGSRIFWSTDSCKAQLFRQCTSDCVLCRARTRECKKSEEETTDECVNLLLYWFSFLCIICS